MKLENDEAYSKITSEINYEDIKRTAYELGMKNAVEGQIIYYNGAKHDYMRENK